MMNNRKRLGYFVIFCLGFAFTLYKYRDIPFLRLREELGKCNLQWVLFATIAHLINHSLRAYRWKLLLRGSQQNIKFRSALLAEMSGFCMTTIFSRLGEIARCRGLKKLEGTKVSVSLGSVVVERSVDMFFFAIILVIFAAFRIEIISDIWQIVSFDFRPSFSFYQKALLGSLAALLLSFLLYKRSLWHYVIDAVLSFLGTLKQLFFGVWGSDSIMIWGSTFLIWLFHFFVEYLTFFAFPETSLLGPNEGLFVFLLANLGMAAPVPGGIGVYEVLVSGALRKQGVPEVTALAYALITHAVQMFNAFVVGGLCSLAILFYPEKKALEAEKGKET